MSKTNNSQQAAIRRIYKRVLETLSAGVEDVSEFMIEPIGDSKAHNARMLRGKVRS